MIRRDEQPHRRRVCARAATDDNPGDRAPAQKLPALATRTAVIAGGVDVFLRRAGEPRRRHAHRREGLGGDALATEI